MKGIILAGGSGSRLNPMTRVISKQLLSIYDKPMVYYPTSVLMLAGIRDIVLISTPQHIDLYKKLFGDGTGLGLRFQYIIQDHPRGLADAFLVSEEFIEDEKVALILGDNVFYGQGFSDVLDSASNLHEGALVFGYYVKDPENFGVVHFDDRGKVLSLEEKPKNPQSHYAVPGLYFYDETVVERAKSLKPSDRGELEITDLNISYLNDNQLNLQLLGRGFAWLDTGTCDGLLEASNFVGTIQKRQGLYIACLEEIAFKKGFISAGELKQRIDLHEKTEYGEYLKQLLDR